MTAVTQALVDAKDDARHAEAQLALAEAINRFDRRTVTNTYWIIGTMIAFNFAVLAFIVALTR